MTDDDYLQKLRNTSKDFKNQGFAINPNRTIHDIQSVKFSKDILGYTGEQLSVLREGLRTETDILECETYQERNNNINS